MIADYRQNKYIDLAKPKAKLLIAVTDDKGKRELFFLGSETQKMINCEHVFVQRVVLLFFPLKF